MFLFICLKGVFLCPSPRFKLFLFICLTCFLLCPLSRFKQNVWCSRINTTRALVRAIDAAPQRPDVFVNVSGVSIYPADDVVYTESSAPLPEYDFMSKLCHHWEESANLPANVLAAGTRCVKIRCGVVLGRESGMIASLLPPFQWGVGGRVGNGCQPLPWIHADDIVGLIRFAVETPAIRMAVLNGVAPQIVTNGEFTKAFAHALRRPALFPLPEFVVKAIFGDERAVMLLEGAKVKPVDTMRYGFRYKYPTIEEACAEVAQKYGSKECPTKK